MSDPNVYTAERILAKRKHHGVTQYHIKWKGYSLKDSTWEPAENILDPTLLINFEQSVNKNKKSSAASTSSNTNTTTSAIGNSTQNSTSSTSSSTTVLNSSGSSSNASSVTNESRTTPAASTIGKAPRQQQGRIRARRRSYLEQRQEQLQLQRHIELQQQQKTHSGITSSSPMPATITTTTSPATFTKNGDKRSQLLIFNPQGKQDGQTFVEEIYEPRLTKEPILVTDVTSQDLTVTISECRTPDGFFRRLS